MDPLIFLPSIIPVGAIAGRIIHKKIKEEREEESRMRQITYFSAEGKLETKVVRADSIDDSGNAYDANGFRIGYSPHYARNLEMEILGTALTTCDCNDCKWEAEQQEYREQQRAEELARIEQERVEAKRRAERMKREAEQRAAREKAERERKDREAYEKAEREREFNLAWNAGKYDDMSIRDLLKKGISKDIIVDRLGGPIVWPEYAIAGTKEVTYEKEKVADTVGGETTKYYKVIRTYFPNGEMDFVRVEVTKQTFDKHEPVRSRSADWTINRHPSGTGYDTDWIEDRLRKNAERNRQYLEDLKRKKTTA